MTKVVYLNDLNVPYENAVEHFNNANIWARNQCQSYIDYHIQDVSDVSLMFDHVAAYKFKDSKDALMFQLKWRDN